MKQRKWKQCQLAAAMEVSASEISLLMNNRRGWSLDMLQRFTAATNCAVEVNEYGIEVVNG